MQTAYVGPATVLVNNRECVVQALLWEHVDLVRVGTSGYLPGLRSWGGTLTGLDAEVAWAVMDSGNARLRIDEREGNFLAAEGVLSGGGPMKITGSGPAPFQS